MAEGATVRPARGVEAALASLAFATVNRFRMALLYGRARRLTVKHGGFRPGQSEAVSLAVLAWKRREKQLAEQVLRL